jgi:DNA-binding NarL/FixJ family response regulator
MTNILLADDHQMITDGIKALLADEGQIKIVGEARNGLQVLDILKREGRNIHVIVLDINMPGMDGIETSRRIRREYPWVRILILSMYDKPGFIQQLIKAGVSGYILKNTGKDEFLTAITKIMNNEEYFSKEVTDSVLKSYRSHMNEGTAELTKREQEILKLLANAHTTQEIAEKLFISPHTVDTHRKNLLSKLNLKSTPALVKYALENGYNDPKF